MSDFEDVNTTLAAWLQPLDDAGAPCGADLEYDNDFLALTQAVAGKPESQFGPAEPPDWRAAVEMAEALFERTRDLRIAIAWARGLIHLRGYGALVPVMTLLNGLLEGLWEDVHPRPDPDDGDPYGRVNALQLLVDPQGLLGDLRDARLIEDRSIGLLLVRDAETALGLAPHTAGRDELNRDQVARMVAAAVGKSPALREQWQAAVAQTQALAAKVKDRLADHDAPELRPLHILAKGIAGLLPAAAESDAEPAESATAGDEAPAHARLGAKGLSGSVNSREDAMRAIDLVIEFLERTEPANPAPLFLRRARQLVGHNFLQLMKVLAPEALAEVARVVGVDPQSVEDPGNAA